MVKQWGETMKNEYLIYLRKSRKDMDAERAGAGETLARHEAALVSLAQSQGLVIGAVYREIVSGETIAARPKMQQLLTEVEAGRWTGVLVMEIERLARGDTKDQGIVAEAFKFGNTKIITPAKTYDPENEFDEEYFEFGLFMSRREYKTINRRIQRGRLASVKEGRYIASQAPYGYRRVKLEQGKGYTLEIMPEEAKVVQLIFHLYTAGLPSQQNICERLGSGRIAGHLNALHIPGPKNNPWSASSIRDLLANPTYTGKVRWQWRREVKKITNGQISKSRKKDHQCLVYDGLHEPIISPEVYQQAQSRRQNQDFTPLKTGSALQNPLSGLVFCQKCGSMMTRLGPSKKNKYSTLKCPTPGCDNISAPLFLIEQSLLWGLEKWLAGYWLTWPKQAGDDHQIFMASQKEAMDKLSRQIEKQKLQLNRTYDLLEQGIYTKAVFLERTDTLTGQISAYTNQLEKLKKTYAREITRQKAGPAVTPAAASLLEIYRRLPQAAVKNQMLKQMVKQVTYLKTQRNKKGEGDDPNFELAIFPRLPECQ